MLRTIHLHGYLAEKYAPNYKLDVRTPAEALHALMIQLKGFDQDIRAGEFVCIRGSTETGIECDSDLLQVNLGSVTDFHLMPAMVGGKSSGGKILMGVALIAATVFTAGAFWAAAPAVFGGSFAGAAASGGLAAALSAGFGGLGLYTAGIGAMLILGGTAQALSSMPKSTATQDLNSVVDDKPGYLFNGAINTSEQGAACPLVFGRIRAGTVVVSAGIVAERTGDAVGGGTVGPGGGSTGASTGATNGTGSTTTTGPVPNPGDGHLTPGEVTYFQYWP